MPPNAVQTDLVRDLRKQVEEIRISTFADQETFSSSCAALDLLLPGHGFHRGTLVECFVPECGSGAITFSLLMARQACREGGAIVVLDRQRKFYPPAAAAWGIDLEKLILVQPENEKDELWAIDQSLRCTGVAVVWAMVDCLDATTFRRWQLAAESSGSIGWLIRPARVQGQPSWAETQLLVQSLPCLQLPDEKIGNPHTDVRRMRVQLLRSRNQNRQGCIELEIDHLTGELRKSKNANRKTHSLHLASQLAHPKTRRRSTGT